MPSTIEKGKAPAAAGVAPAVHPAIWKAVAFSCPNLPSAGSAVYYFSDGHAEQCCSRPLQNFLPSFTFLCHLAAVNLHADPTTEQVFATFCLTTNSSSPTTSTAKTFRGGAVTSVVKTLFESEINKYFLILPATAHEVFRYSKDELDVYDLNNRRWTFGHVVIGSPPMHLLTSGSHHFLKCKKLVAGDAVVFVRDADGTIFVGCRRFDGDKCDAIAMNMEASSSLMPKMVIEALRWAVEDGEGMVEGRYYPDSKLPVYVVKKEVVETAMKIQWRRGMRVQKELEMADGFTCCFYGTVTALSPNAFRTLWRMLEVIWNKTGKSTLENPWDVEPLQAFIKIMPEEENIVILD